MILFFFPLATTGWNYQLNPSLHGIVLVLVAVCKPGVLLSLTSAVAWIVAVMVVVVVVMGEK